MREINFKVKKAVNKYSISLIIASVALVALFQGYMDQNLGGDINLYALTSAMFGMPSHLIENGERFTYVMAGETGWDGQFNYYIANDLLNNQGTAAHIDNPAYRWARPGLSFLAFISSKILGLEYISQAHFAIVTVGITILGITALTYITMKSGLSPLLIFAWALFPGQLITTFSGLSDACADSFFAIFIALYLGYALRTIRAQKKVRRFDELMWTLALSFAGVLCVLSREIYLIFFMVCLLLKGMEYVFSKAIMTSNIPKKFLMPRIRKILIVPSLVTTLGYLTYNHLNYLRFGARNAGTVVTKNPLTTLRYLYCNFNDCDLAIPSNSSHYGLGHGLSLMAHTFLLFLGLTIGIAAIAYTFKIFRQTNKLFLGRLLSLEISIFVMLACLVYFFFGPTVLFDWTGFIKADSTIIMAIIVGTCMNKITTLEGAK